MPISIETIEAKLNRKDYPTLTTLESDVKRMVQNAKQYNESKSDVFLDAERIRKATFNWMSKMNPAYKGGGYAAFPTPIPAELEKKPKLTLTNGSAKGKVEDKGSSGKPLADPTPRGQTSSSPPAIVVENGSAEVANDELMDFAGKDFQQAQEQIIAECIAHTDEG